MVEIMTVRQFKKIVKYNGGIGALLCNECKVIIATGFIHDDKEHYCAKCKQAQNTVNAEAQ